MASKAIKRRSTGRRLLSGKLHGIARPPARGAPEAVYPIAVTSAQRALAPTPVNDRFPIVVGQALNASYAAAVFRLASTGYLQQYVDFLNELLEQDPNLFSGLQKRILATANGWLELSAPKLPKGHPDAKRAQEILEFCQVEVSRLPDLSQTFASLLWAIYYGIGACEIFWTRDLHGWHIDRFGFIHRRRLAYPNYQSWDLYVWDQGQVLGWDTPWGSSPTNSNLFGLRIADWPGKFWVHAPQIRGDYPTRDGIGREVALWSILKRVGARGAGSYLERFAKGFMDVSFTTTHAESGKTGPREATEEDIARAMQIMQQIGAGSGSGTAHPDSIQINAKSFDGGAGSKLSYQDWISVCDGQENKAILGGNVGTDKGSGGNRALGEVIERSEIDLETYDANVLGESFKRDVLTTLVRLNYPDDVHLTPNAQLHVETDPDPGPLVKVAKDLVEIGAEVDLDALAEKAGIALIPNTNKDDDGNLIPRVASRANILELLKAATAMDIPIDVEVAGELLHLPVMTAEEADAVGARRTRVVAAAKGTPIEPSGDDPNDPNATSPADVDADGDPIVPTPDDGAPTPPKTPKAKPGKAGKNVKSTKKNGSQ